MVNSYSGIPISIWYDWKNDGIDPSNGEHNFGLRENDVTVPKLAYLAMKIFTDEFSNYKFSKRIKVKSDDDYVFVFKNQKGETKTVCWTVGNSHEIKLPKNIKGTIKSIYGETIGKVGNNRILYLTDSPKYIY